MFDKAALFAYDDTKIVQVKCPEWGENGNEIYVRTMSSAQRDIYDMDLHAAGKRNKEIRAVAKAEGVKPIINFNMRAELVVACACNKGGELLFEPSDAVELGEKRAGVVNRIFDAAMILKNVSDEDVEEMEKSLESEAS